MFGVRQHICYSKHTKAINFILDEPTLIFLLVKSCAIGIGKWLLCTKLYTENDL